MALDAAGTATTTTASPAAVRPKPAAARLALVWRYITRKVPTRPPPHLERSGSGFPVAGFLLPVSCFLFRSGPRRMIPPGVG